MPFLRAVDQQQHHEGDHQHHRRDGRGTGVIILLQLGDDHQRRDLRHAGHVAGDEDHRAVLAQGPSECQGEAGHQRRQDCRQDDMDENLPAAGPQGYGGLFMLRFEILQHRLHGAHHERQADEDHRQHHAEGGEGGLDPDFQQRLAEHALRRVERGQRDTRHRGGQREGQVDHRVDQLAEGKVVARQHPGHDQPREDVEDRGDQRAAEAEAIGGQHPRAEGGRLELPPRKPRRAQEQGRDRDQHDQAGGEQRHPERRPEAWNNR